MIPQFVGKSMPLSESSLTNVCSQLVTDAAAIWAVLHVETAGCGFLADRRPPIPFERHIFSRETNRQFDTQGTSAIRRRVATAPVGRTSMTAWKRR
jgi:hypothetical protein